MFLDAARDKFSRLPYWIEYGGKAYAFIDSENTYALPAKIDAARFARGRNKNFGHPHENIRGVCRQPNGPKTALQARRVLRRMLVDATTKAALRIPTLTIWISWRLSDEGPRRVSPHHRSSHV